MDDRIPPFLKAAKAVAAAAKAVEAAGKALAPEKPAAAVVADATARAADALATVAGVDALAAALGADLARRAESARVALERERALLAGQVAAALRAGGLEVDGNLPLLRAGALTLEFAFGTRGACTVWFGPRKQKLAACGLDPAVIAARALEQDAALFGGPFDEAAYLATLERAYRVAAVRAGVADGERVPLTALLAEVAFMRQDDAFRADPRRELYTAYGRVEFAADLSRLRSRRVGGRELRLDVATMAQTRRPVDHLWVPRGRTGDGVNYATASFVKGMG